MKEILQKLSEKQFTATDAADALKMIMSGDASESQIAAFLVLLEQLDKSPEILASLAQVLKSYSTPCDFTCSDIVGTGGDGHNTFNVSTASAIIAAGAGCKIAKVSLECNNNSMEIVLLLLIVGLQIFWNL